MATEKESTEQEKTLDFEQRLAHLPENQRKNVLRQYEMPNVNATLLDVLRWATSFEVALMGLGTVLAVAAGSSRTPPFYDLRFRPSLSNDHHWKSGKRFRRLRS